MSIRDDRNKKLRVAKPNNLSNLLNGLIVPLLYLILVSSITSFLLLFTGTDVYMVTVDIALVAAPFLIFSLFLLTVTSRRARSS